MKTLRRLPAGNPAQSRSGRLSPGRLAALLPCLAVTLLLAMSPRVQAEVLRQGPFDELQSLTPPGQGPYAFIHNANGQRLQTVTPLGATTTQTWNDRNLLATVQTPATGTTTFTYDAQGRLATQQDALGTRALQYDAAGNLRTVQDTSGPGGSRTYDSRHRVASYTDGRGHTVQYTYDRHGNLTRLTYPDGLTVVEYEYDRHDRLIRVRDGARVTQYAWDAANRLRRLQRPNGTTRRLTYDRAG